ncbi:MAG: glutamine--tRNA ligase/YqeY domain fusion protein [Nitrospina sp.]|nr:glutamine--tRNA ligase/YqeY domain fusion protein [Nitrospina sp.]
MNKENDSDPTTSNFIREIVKDGIATNKQKGHICTRFPPEPNGFLHIGHAKSICLNFGLANEFKGTCNLRFDDTNPSKEEDLYVQSIIEDIKWLGFSWAGEIRYTSEYFDQLYDWAVCLIKKELAYVDDLNADEIREYRGTPTQSGKNSPFRNRSVEENINLFARMKNGEFSDGAKVLRAKIDMASGNLNMRDPVLYRILRARHHRMGDKWCIYPMYDFAHGQSDSIEKITHSICTLEFEDHRPLYDWIIKNLEIYHPQQIEFARLNLGYTLLSKRKLLQLVKEDHVTGWDDPRMPTISGMRRRGYTPESIRDFCERIGVAKANSTVEMALLEHCVREDLNKKAKRVMVVLRPLKVTITNYPEGQIEELTSENNPEDSKSGTRQIPFSGELYIEQEDFLEDPPKKFFRLAPGKEVRLKHAYIIKCEEMIKDRNGNITELKCTYDPDSKTGGATAGRKIKGTLHWVSAQHAKKAEVRIYNHLFNNENPGNGQGDLTLNSELNAESVEILQGCKVEPALLDAKPGARFQFLRMGYFCADLKDFTPGNLVFNRAVTLRDTWAKIAKQNK